MENNQENKEYVPDVGWVPKVEPGEFEDVEGVYKE